MTKLEVMASFKAEQEPLLKAQFKSLVKHSALYAEAHAAETDTKVDDAIVAFGSMPAQAALNQIIDEIKL